jgi:nucleotide-binding universal stress UspA family protein
MSTDLGYHRVLVPVAANRESEEAVDVACRLASSRGAVVTLVAVVEIPTVLPIDAHMIDEEGEAHRLLERAAAVVDSYGVGLSRRLVRSRDAAAAILHEAGSTRCELMVIGAPRRQTSRRGLPVFGSTVEHVLKHANCRVMLIGPPPIALYSVTAAA